MIRFEDIYETVGRHHPGADLELEIGYFYPYAAGWSDAGPTTLCYVVSATSERLDRPLNPTRSGTA